MKFMLSLASVLLLFQVALAGTTTKQKASKTGTEKPKLGTSFRFDGSALQGKFQSPFGTAATVENDKYLEDLLGARKNFNDRTAREVERN